MDLNDIFISASLCAGGWYYSTRVNPLDTTAPVILPKRIAPSFWAIYLLTDETEKFFIDKRRRWMLILPCHPFHCHVSLATVTAAVVKTFLKNSLWCSWKMNNPVIFGMTSVTHSQFIRAFLVFLAQFWNIWPCILHVQLLSAVVIQLVQWCFHIHTSNDLSLTMSSSTPFPIFSK